MDVPLLGHERITSPKFLRPFILLPDKPDFVGGRAYIARLRIQIILFSLYLSEIATS